MADFASLASPFSCFVSRGKGTVVHNGMLYHVTRLHLTSAPRDPPDDKICRLNPADYGQKANEQNFYLHSDNQETSCLIYQPCILKV